MPSTFLSRPVFRLAAALALVAVAACNDSSGPDEDPADEVASIRLTIVQGAATSNFTVASSGAVTPAPLRIPVGTSTVTATFLRADGSTVSAGDLADFQLRLKPAAGLTFARTAPFVGTLTTTAAAGSTVAVELCLFHIEENHCDFGPWQGFSATIGS